jgi:hypothetical protein
VEPSDPSVRKPSLFVGGLIGFLLGALIASIVCWLLAVRSTDFDNEGAFRVFVGVAVLCTFEGYRFAARKRKQLGVNVPTDEWQHFFGSWTFYALATIILVGSFVISAAESLLFDLVYGAPWLQK